jgi:GntR family transcriptional regulator
MSESTSTGLQRQRGSALHHQMFLVLRNGIQSGQYRPGQMLPSEDRLAATFGVSRITVRNALAALQASGLVKRRQGVGTLVCAETVHPALHTPHSDLLTHIQWVGENTQVKLIDLRETSAPVAARAFFRCDEFAPFQRAVRLRSMAGQPLLHVVTYLPEAIGRLVSRRDLNERSLYNILRAHGIDLTSGHQEITAVLAEPATALHLGTPVGAPLLRLRRFHCDQGGRPVEYVEVLASPDRFQVNMTLERHEMPHAPHPE